MILKEGKILCTLLLLILLSPVMLLSEEKTFSMDSLERLLELDRHKALVKTKHDPESQLTPFMTDGCSGGLTSGWNYLATKIANFNEIHGEIPPWQECCITHDHHYHTGGGRDINATESFEARKRADQALEKCVYTTGAGRIDELKEAYHLSADEVRLLYKSISKLMYRAVRIGGIPCSALPWRWGYGWPECE